MNVLVHSPCVTLGRPASRVALAISSAVALFTLSLAGLDPALAASLQRGPFLQVSTPTSVTICWRTDVATDSRVRFGLSATALTNTVNNASSSTIHNIKLTGLAAETRYYYSIGSSSQTLAGATAEFTFKTAPPPGASRPTRVWIIGDSGEPGSNQQAVKNAFLNWTGSRSADVWLMLGDNAYSSGTDSEYQAAVFDAYPEVLRKVPLWPTRGNHDASTSVYYGCFTMPAAAEAGGVPSGTEAYYSFNHGNIHFICLDSEGSSRSTTGAMATWLQSDLAAAAGMEWIIAYWHHPPYTKGSHDSDSESQLQDMRQNFLPILETGGVDLVLTGHSHSYERSYLLNGHYGSSSTLTSTMKVGSGNGKGATPYAKPAGIESRKGAVYAVAGSSAKTSSGSLNHPAMVVSMLRLGSMVLDIDGRSLTARFIDNAGTIRDDFGIMKDANTAVFDPPPPPPPPPSQTPQPTAGGTIALEVRPNPLSESGTEIAYVLPAPGRVTLSVFGADGRRVAQLVDREVEAGRYTLAWNGRGDADQPLPAGVYYAALDCAGQTRVKRIVKLQ